MDVRITARGLERKIADLEAMARRLSDLTPVTRVFAEELKTAVDRSFERSVSPTGEGFAPLLPATLARKARLGRSPKPLIGRGTLRNSVFARGETTTIRYGIGPTAQYGGYHQFGTPTLKPRPFLPVGRAGDFQARGPMQRFLARFKAAVTRYVKTGAVRG